MNAKIYGDADNDSIYNAGSTVTAYGGSGNDTIYHGGSNSSVYGEAGDDVISIIGGIYTAKVSISGSTGNDTIYGNSSHHTMIANSGVDFIQYNNGDGNDVIYNFEPVDTLQIGNGTTDTFSKSTVGSDILVSVGSGVITLSGAATLSNVNILGKEVATVNPLLITLTENADTYNNSLAGATILALGGNDRITNSGANVFVDGGAGNDYIYDNYSNTFNTILGGDGNDVIIGFKAIDTLRINGAVTHSTIKSGSDILVSVDSGVITLKGAASLSSVNIDIKELKDLLVTGTENADTLRNNLEDATINALGGNDYIYNSAANVSINGGAGKDTIYAYGKNVTVDSGADADYIISGGDTQKVSINSGAGNDTVYNGVYGDNATINTGDGDDSVYNGYMNVAGVKVSLGSGNDTLRDWSYNGTINGGKGNDLIQMEQEHIRNVIEYAAGDGNDTIYGFNPTDTLSLTGGTVTGSVISGDDLVLKVGTGSITFKNTRSVNVNGTIFNPSSKTGTNSHDFLTNFNDNATINALGGSDKIANSGSNVLINTGEGDNSVGNYGDNTTIVTGNGNNTILSGTYMHSNIRAGAGNDSIHTGWTSSTIDAGAGNDTIVVHYASSITAGDGDDVIYGYGSTDTIKIAGNYSTSTVGSDILITVGDGSILLKNAKNYTLNIEEIKKEPYLKLEDGNAVYYDENDEVLFTIYGISSSAKLADFTISGTNVTIAKNALGEDDVSLEGESYTLKLANDVPTVSTATNGGWSSLVNGKATYTATAYSDYYTLDDNTITYTAREGGETFTISGIKSTLSSAVAVDEENKDVTLYNAALGTNTITLDSDDYSLYLDESVIQDAGDAEQKFTAFTNGTATYKIFGDRAYYALEGNEVSYVAATADKQFTISGLANNLILEDGELEGVTAVVEEDTVRFILSEKALKDSDVTLSGTNCTLELAEEVTTAAVAINGWSEVVNGTASYSINGKSKYYTLSNGKVVYHAPIAGTLQLTLEGLASTATMEDGEIDGLEVNGNYLTISAAAVGKNVTLKYNNGFNITLTNDVKNTSFTGQPMPTLLPTMVRIIQSSAARAMILSVSSVANPIRLILHKATIRLSSTRQFNRLQLKASMSATKFSLQAR